MTEASAAHRSTTYGVLPNHNAAPVAPLPRVLYWSERVNGWWPGVARACAACGGRLDATPQDTPSPGPGRVVCLWCGREPAEVHDRRHPAPRAIPDDPPCRPGRPPAPVVAPTAPPKPSRRRGKSCPECGVRTINYDRSRCIECRERVYWNRSHAARLVALLADGTPMHRTDVAEQIGVSLDGLRQVVRKARLAGYAICTTHADGHYALEVQP